MAEETDNKEAEPNSAAEADTTGESSQAPDTVEKGASPDEAGAASPGEEQPGTDAAPAGEEQPGADAAPTPAAAKKARRARVAPVGIAHIRATFNNTIVTVTDVRGNVVSWSSAGRAGFKGSRKSTSFAATVVGQDAARQAAGKGMNEVEVRVQGAGSGRESAIRAIQSSGLNVSVIKDVTPVPHNGCRSRKKRRV